MRPKAKAAAAQAKQQKTAAESSSPDDDQNQVKSSFQRVPTSFKDLQERVSFRMSAGYELTSASPSGLPLQGGAPLPPNFADNRQWIVGDIMVGAKDILLPSLGGYFLSSYQFDTTNGLASRSDLVVPGDSTGQRFAVKAGYAEYGAETATGDKPAWWVRAGRQFRLDGGAMFAYFDGLTFGYHSKGVQLSVFGGERAVLYVNTPGGLTFGATASIDLDKINGTPLKFSADFMGLKPDNISGASTLANAPPAPGLRDLLQIAAQWDPSKKVAIDARARFVDGGNGFGFGRAGARFKLTPSPELLVVVDGEQRAGTDLAYDLAAPSQVDIINIARGLGIGIASPINSAMFGARVDWRPAKASAELVAFGRALVPEDKPTLTSQNGWIEAGAAAAYMLGPIWTTLQYTFRDYQLDATANGGGPTAMPPVAFDNLAGSGISTMHEIALDFILRRSPKVAGKNLRATIGGFFRVYDVQTPYLTVSSDGRIGGRGDLQYWFTRDLHAGFAAEIAQPSPTFDRDLSVIASARAMMEARW
jgi:hypothetical protein